jgi:hypothetical protein
MTLTKTNTESVNSKKEGLNSKNGNSHMEKVNQIMQNGITSKGLSYKVQVLATRFSPSRPSAWVKSYYNLNTEVENGQFEGWNKYSVGAYSTYREASVAKIQAREAVKDAFVVAFQNGTRISVPEALRIEQMNQ